MPAFSAPPVPYGATALRPGWADLPARLRATVAARLGAPVVDATTATGGFTRGFAGVLSTASGERVFVKAARLAGAERLADAYAREAAVTAALPAGVRAARPRWTLTVAGHFVLCLDAVDARIPALPWAPAELDATLAAYAEAAEALRDPPPALAALHPPRLAELARDHLTGWREAAVYERVGGPTEPPGPGSPEPPGPDAASPTGLVQLVRARLPELTALEARLPGYAHHPGLIHGDLRLDNVLIDRAGSASFCDWTWVCFGPPWFDLAGLLVTAYASGLDTDAVFAAHPAAGDAPPDALDVALAALSGHWLTSATADPGSASPHIQAHQRWSGEMALDWLARRRGWR